MKRFRYFMTTDGGMEATELHSSADLPELFKNLGWMGKHCIKTDQELVTWMDTAEVGDLYEHRLGDIVRLKDETSMARSDRGRDNSKPNN